LVESVVRLTHYEDMMNKYLLFALFSLLPLGRTLEAQRIAPITQEQRSWLTKANRHEKNGWIFIHI
jgi:hypothetical protein